MATLRSNFSFEYKTSEGQPVRHSRSLITPISRILKVRMLYWGFVWNRPVAIRVDDGESAVELPIIDVTLLAQIGLPAIGLAATALAYLAGRPRGLNRRQESSVVN